MVDGAAEFAGCEAIGELQGGASGGGRREEGGGRSEEGEETDDGALDGDAFGDAAECLLLVH